MTLSREYQDKFDALKQRFDCSNTELEALLRETSKSGKGYSHGTLENLIDYQLQQLDSPRRRIYAIGNIHPPRRRNPRKEPGKERLSAREIRELFGANAKFSRKNEQNRRRVGRLRKTAILSKKKAIKKMLRDGRQKLKAYGTSQTRMGVLLSRLRDEGKRELFREGRRQVRGHARRQLRRFLPLY